MHDLFLFGAAAATVALAAVLAIGVVSGPLRAACLFLACLLLALVVVLMPSRLRTKVAPFAAAFVAAAGVLPTFLAGDDEPGPRPLAANPQYLAELVARGPFTEQLPPPLRAATLEPVNIGDPSAAARLGEVRLIVETGSDELTAYAHVEIYSTPEAAAQRKAARVATMVRLYGRKNVYDACTDEYGAHGGGWTCVEARGYAYAEAAIAPSSNANTPFATSMVSALLRYTDRLTKVAS